MRIRGFEYHAPAGLKEALDILDHYGPRAAPLAGGTDLFLEMRHGKQPEHLVWLGNLNELRGLSRSGEEIRIGSLCLYADLAEDEELRSTIPILAKAASLIGSWQIRNTATIGGNLCHASPAADSAGPLLALEAKVVLAGREEERTLGLTEFFVGPGRTAMAPGELLKESIVPLKKAPTPGRYPKLTRNKPVALFL